MVVLKRSARLCEVSSGATAALNESVNQELLIPVPKSDTKEVSRQVESGKSTLTLCTQDITVLFENYPLRRGVPFHVIIRGTPTKALDNLIVRTRINVGSFFSVLDVQNLCKRAPEGCPLKTKLQEQRLTCRFSCQHPDVSTKQNKQK